MRRYAVAALVLALLLVFGALTLSEYAVVHDTGSISVVMCPGCKETFLQELRQGTREHCALYDLGKETAALLASKNALVLTDKDTHPDYGQPYNHAGLMHNKFCIIDEDTILTGSYNPTDGGELNRNNLLVIHSKTLAANYEREFAAMEASTVRPSIQHIIWINDTRVENYFCPLDGCESHVLDSLEKARSSIVFMTFSFTSDPIGELLEQKMGQGVRVEGVCDKGQLDPYTECGKLGAKNYTGQGLLHHKVFVIDNETVITGSYNPTASGDRRNRENILIITDRNIAQQYLDEYQAVLAEAQ